MNLKSIEVAAPPQEVAQVLARRLAPEDLALLRIDAPEIDPFAPGPLRDLPDMKTVIEFVGSAAASGIAYDIMKKAAVAVRDAFGNDRVKDEDKPGEPDKAHERDGEDRDGER